ncbi:TetR/AcrR family transcriptional regulator [Ruania zhangjianzhongii]|uniref:TetR/AcrR family transcriptional regulator n=1 Tax=Ruania zhangjianzhongii TaxID=2603206 RepID=UPI0011CB8EFE|nr:TetR/AcrR family transcriptional regulator [Ruania zhangjianzhongii]
MAKAPDQTRRNPHSTEAILRASLELAQEHGWAKVSIDGIAARAGVSKRTIYRWWPSKGAVVLDAYVQRIQHTPLMTPQPTPHGDIRTDLVRLVKDGWIQTVGDSATLVASLIGEAQHDPHLGTQLWEHFITPANKSVMERISLGQDEGELAPGVDPYRATELIYGQIFVRLLQTPDAVDAPFLENCVDLALSGLSPSRPAPESESS